MTDVLTLDGVAAALLVSNRTARRLVTSGRLAGFRVGHQWRVERTMLQRFVDAQHGQALHQQHAVKPSASVRDLKGWDTFL